MFSESLRNRNALITGGGTGIGREVAVAFAKAGARVAITYRSHEPDDVFRAEIKKHSGHSLKALRVDATDEGEVKSALATLADEHFRLDVLINNVGGLIKRQSIRDMNIGLWREVMAVNLDATFLMTHHALPLMNTQGRIINVASLAGRNGGHRGATAYAAAKAAIFGFTRGLAKELAVSGITVNALAPGFIEATPFHDTFTTPQSKALTIEAIPLGRAGTPSDVAAQHSGWLQHMRST